MGLGLLLSFFFFWAMPDDLDGLNLSFLLFWKSPAAVSGLVRPLFAAPRVQVLPFGLDFSFGLVPVTECFLVSVLINFSQLWILCWTFKGFLTNIGLTGALLVPLGLSFTLLLVGAVLECALLIGVDVIGSNPSKLFKFDSSAISSYSRSALHSSQIKLSVCSDSLDKSSFSISALTSVKSKLSCDSSCPPEAIHYIQDKLWINQLFLFLL